jgi:hypothetical protein
MIPLKSFEYKWLISQTDLKNLHGDIKKEIHEIIRRHQNLMLYQQNPVVDLTTLREFSKQISDSYQDSSNWLSGAEILQVLRCVYQGVRNQKIRDIILSPTQEDYEKNKKFSKLKTGIKIVGAGMVGFLAKSTLDIISNKYDVFADLGINKSSTAQLVHTSLNEIERVSEEVERISFVKQYIDRGEEIYWEVAMLLLFTTLEGFFSDSLKTTPNGQKRTIGAILKYCRSLKPEPIISRGWYDKIMQSTTMIRNRVSHGDFDFSRTTKEELFEVVNSIETFINENKHLKRYNSFNKLGEPFQ